MSNWSTRLRDSKERFLFGGGSAVAIALADELDAKDAEIERLNDLYEIAVADRVRMHTQNAKLQAVVDAAKEFKEWWHEDMRGSVSYDKLCAALAALENNDE